jgi:hypothetical protein
MSKIITKKVAPMLKRYNFGIHAVTKQSWTELSSLQIIMSTLT